MVIFTFLYFRYFSIHTSYSLAYALFGLNVILIQGSFYWFVKWKRLKSKQSIFPNLPKVFIFFKTFNLTLLSIAPIVFVIEMLIDTPVHAPFWIVLFVYMFAIIEYVNYFQIQLTNYKNGRGKKASMAKEMEKLKRDTI